MQRNSQTLLETGVEGVGGASVQTDVGLAESLTLRMPSGVNQIGRLSLLQKASVAVRSEGVYLLGVTDNTGRRALSLSCCCINKCIWDSFGFRYFGVRHAAISTHKITVGFLHRLLGGLWVPALGFVY